MKKRLVLALGGNALRRDGDDATAAAQKEVASQVGELIAKFAKDYQIVITHGNGPQVGNILLHEEKGASESAPAMPLETAVAMTQGEIGYWLTQALYNAFRKTGQKHSVTAITTQTLINRDDPAFNDPDKPIGQFYTAEQAKQITADKGWVMKEDAGRGWRRVVPSPKPIDIIEKDIVLDLLEKDAVVITIGGGGVPVYHPDNSELLEGIDAVVDKDLASETLATAIDADIFVMLTGVPYAYINYGKPDQYALETITPEEAAKHIKDGHFAAGSMLPKIQAAMMFAGDGKTSIITSLEDLDQALAGKAGTIVK